MPWLYVGNGQHPVARNTFSAATHDTDASPTQKNVAQPHSLTWKVYHGVQGVLTCLAGRLILDTYLCSRDLLKEVEYSLSHLCSKLLHQPRADLQPHQVPSLSYLSA
jgi:hypothetical protein